MSSIQDARRQEHFTHSGQRGCHVLRTQARPLPCPGEGAGAGTLRAMLRFPSVILSIAILALPSLSAAADVPAPETFLGHRVGEDRKLAPWPKVVEYLRLVDTASDRVSIESAGTST